MVHADLICVPQLMSGEQALAAQIGGSGAVPATRPTIRPPPLRAVLALVGLCSLSWGSGLP